MVPSWRSSFSCNYGLLFSSINSTCSQGRRPCPTEPCGNNPCLNGSNTRAATGPGRPPLFQPRKIVLAKGGVTTADRSRLADSIIGVYPKATVIEQPAVPHNKVRITDEGRRPARPALQGSSRPGSRRAQERRGTQRRGEQHLPELLALLAYGFCPYGCSYCYLAGTQGVRFSPSIKVYVNLGEILGEIDRVARRLGREEAFYLGKLQDGMALDPLTGYSRTMIPFFAEHPYARLRVLSKCADFDNVLDLDHRGHTVLCWSLNPPAVRKDYELITPPVEDPHRRHAEVCRGGISDPRHAHADHSHPRLAAALRRPSRNPVDAGAARPAHAGRACAVTGRRCGSWRPSWAATT